jgi:hypothetical protein
VLFEIKGDVPLGPAYYNYRPVNEEQAQKLKTDFVSMGDKHYTQPIKGVIAREWIHPECSPLVAASPSSDAPALRLAAGAPPDALKTAAGRHRVRASHLLDDDFIARLIALKEVLKVNPDDSETKDEYEFILSRRRFVKHWPMLLYNAG